MVPLGLTVTCGVIGFAAVGIFMGVEKVAPEFVEWLKKTEAPSASQATMAPPFESTNAEGI
jgi:hypothetical protein